MSEDSNNFQAKIGITCMLIASFLMCFPIQVVSSAGNVLTVSIFASLLGVNMLPENPILFIATLGIFIFVFMPAITKREESKNGTRN